MHEFQVIKISCYQFTQSFTFNASKNNLVDKDFVVPDSDRPN